MIRLRIAVGGGRSIAALALQVLDDLHTRMREHGIEIVRTDGEDETHTFTLDPPAAGTLTVAWAPAAGGANAVVFTVRGIAALTLGGVMRAVADKARQCDRRAIVSLTQTTPRRASRRPAPG